MTEFSDPLGVQGPNEEDPDFEFVDPDQGNEPEDDIDIYFQNAQKTSMANLAIVEPTEDDKKDLFVNVDHPEKHVTTMESYITFRVVTKTTRSEFDQEDYQVRRRFNDFLWLRERLEAAHPTHLVPPLPEKNSLKRFDRFNQDFVKTRMHGLDKFMNRICDHPVLSFNKHVQIFLTAKQSDFNASKKEGNGLFTKVLDSFHNVSSSYMIKTRAPEFDEVFDYTVGFSDKLGTLERISQRVVKEQEDLLQDYEAWGPVFTLWSSSEDKLSHALQAFAKSVEKNYLALEELNSSTEEQLNQPLKEYILYSEVIKAVLRRRDAIQMEYEITQEELNRKKDEQSQWVRKVEQLQDKATVADSDLRADIDRWHRLKKKDFKSVFMNLADRHIEYYTKCLAAWEEVIPHIQKTEQFANNQATASAKAAENIKK